MRTTSRSGPAAHGAATPASRSRAASPSSIACVSSDPTLIQALRAAVPQAQVIAVPSPNALIEVLLQGAFDVIVVDVPALGGSAPTLLTHLARQFPDAAIIGVGDRHDEAAIAHLISTGAVYRFLHRPLSAARARVFVEAAVRRHEAQQPAAPPAAARAPTRVPGRASSPAPIRAPARAPAVTRTAPAVPRAPLRIREWQGPRTGWAVAAAVAALVAIAVAALLWAGGDGTGRDAAPAGPPPVHAAADPARPAAAAPAQHRSPVRQPSAPADDGGRPAR